MVLGTAGSAFASGWTPPTLPSGAADPWEGFTNTSNQYSSADMAKILKNRIALNAEGLAEDVGLSGTDAEVAASRLYRLQSLLRLRPALVTLGTEVPYVTLGAAVIVGGYLTYKVIRHYTDADGNAQTATDYVGYSRERLGGAEVSVWAHQGVQWYPHTTVGDRFGWKHTSDINRLLSGDQPGWVFNYAVDIMGAGAGVGLWRALPNGSYSPGAGDTYYPAPSTQYCDTGSNWENGCIASPASTMGNSTCLKADGSGAGTCIELFEGLEGAMWNTFDLLDGVRSPLLVHSDMTFNATGHPWESQVCNRLGSIGVNCGLAYIPETSWERAAGSISTTSPDGGSLAGTDEATVPSDAGNATDVAKVAADETPCVRALFNAIVDPVHYSYSGCANAGADADSGSGTVVIPPPTITPGTTFVPFVIPMPLPGETYADYTERLRAKGWLGTLTLTSSSLDTTAVSGSAYATAELDSVTKVSVSPYTGTSVVPLYATDGSTAAWPANAPTVTTAQTGIHLEFKPPGSIFPPPPPSGVDFGPLTALDPGCKFPYGFVCYAQEVTGWFNVTPDAPVFNIAITVPALAGGGTLNYGPVDLAVIDSYMTVWRTLLSIVLWIGAVYFVATRFLGFQAGGDPGEALDDVL